MAWVGRLIVIKIGGSLFNKAPKILNKINESGCDFLIVPGGGRLADAVRDIDSEHSLSDDAAHWMAVLAMEQYAYYLSDKTGIELSGAPKKRGKFILLPYTFLKKHDDLPHSWDITSDTIAAVVAHRTNSRFIKVTDVDGIILKGKLLKEANATELLNLGATCIDKALPSYLIEYRMDVFIVNGNHEKRVLDVITQKGTKGTIVRGK